MKSSNEKKFTSTTTKLLHNFELLTCIQNWVWVPQSIQLAPTDKCNLNCSFCSVKNREMKELTVSQCKNVLKTFSKLGAKTVELTGGGDITMHKRVNDILSEAFSLGYRVGLITNGILLNKNIWRGYLEQLTWIRVSLNSLDYVDEVKLDIPHNVVLGFSYVWNEKSDIGKLKQVSDYAKKYKAKYVRVVPNCLDVKEIEKYKEDIAPYVKKYKSFFLQQKEYTVPHRCWMGYIKPFVNSDGYVYHCSANPLIARKFNKKFRMCSIDNIEKTWKKVKPFKTKHCKEGKCFFKEHNDLLEEVMLSVEHKDFI